MSERYRRRFENWVRAKVYPRASRSMSPPESTRKTDGVIDNIALALGLVQQVANIVNKVPFIAPAAAIMSEILNAYKVRAVSNPTASRLTIALFQELKDTNEKRDVLLANITGLTRDLCGTILRMEATNHTDLIGRLKTDIEAYTTLGLFFTSLPGSGSYTSHRLLTKASKSIRVYDNQGIIRYVLARNELGSTLTALNQ
jgi:hypothetical protein